MASVARARFGTHPSFLHLLSRKRTLFDTLAPLAPNNLAVGARVVPTKWVNAGIADSFWTVQDVSFSHGFRRGRVSAIRTWRGVQDSSAKEIPASDSLRLSWRLYSDPAEHAALKMKLGISAGRKMGDAVVKSKKSK